MLYCIIGIVSGALKIESFLRTLEVLGEKYAKTASVQRDLASIQKKCLLDLQSKYNIYVSHMQCSAQLAQLELPF